eukprot:8557116-Alexandrium_andersonii.AAC.1
MSAHVACPARGAAGARARAVTPISGVRNPPAGFSGALLQEGCDADVLRTAISELEIGELGCLRSQRDRNAFRCE